MRRPRFVAIIMVGLGVLPSAAWALRCAPGCSCVTGSMDLSTGLREQARRTVSGEGVDSTMAFEVTLQRVSSVDSLLPTGLSGRLRRQHAEIEHFVVHRAWSLQRGHALNRRVDNLVPPIQLCPRPNWRRGHRYLVFAEVYEGKIVLIEGCAGIAYGVRERRTRQAIEALNESWFRR